MKTNLLPANIISLVKNEGEGLEFGSIRLEIFLRDGKPRWEVTRSRSIVDDTPQNGTAAKCQKTVVVVT